MAEEQGRDVAQRPDDANGDTHLSPADAKALIEALAMQIGQANFAYHTKDAPEISDAEFDLLRRRLAALEARFPKYARATSPIAR